MGRARDTRLLSDYQKISEFTAKRPYVCITEVKGMPPVAYTLEFLLNGYVDETGKTARKHLLRIIFPEQYPFSVPPKFVFVNGLFHPNVYKNGDVCHGWYLHNWHPGIHIDDLLIDIAKIICFKTDSYNLKSPANFACDAEWIATHPIPADEIQLTEPVTLTGAVVSLPAEPDKKTKPPLAKQQLEKEAEADTPHPIKVRIKAIRNFLTRTGNSK